MKKKLAALAAAGLMLLGVGFAPSAAHAVAKKGGPDVRLRAVDLL
jgi:hypothetical protein